MISEKEKQRRLKISKALMGHPISEKVKLAFKKAGKERLGKKNPAWKGGYFIDMRNGKKMVRIGIKKYTPEYIVIMENYLGRKLERNGRYGEVVHHINGDNKDNRIENLKLFSSHSEHIIEEQKLNSFAKKILYADLIPDLSQRLLEEYEKFNVK